MWFVEDERMGQVEMFDGKNGITEFHMRFIIMCNPLFKADLNSETWVEVTLQNLFSKNFCLAFLQDGLTKPLCMLCAFSISIWIY